MRTRGVFLFALLHSLSMWFQPDASSGSAPSGAPSSGGGGGGMSGNLSQLGFMALIMVVFYLVLIRPQQKRQKELDSLLKSLKKGQKVRTTGGIRGEIVEFKTDVGDEVVLQVADRVKINILRSHVAGIIEPGGEAAEQKA